MGVSNSSVKDGTAGEAWILEGADDTDGIEGAGPVDEGPAFMDSFRGELVGVLAQAYILLSLGEFHGNPETEVADDFHCNN